MRVRIVQAHRGMYVVEKKYWFWPFWLEVEWDGDLEVAEKTAQRLLHPFIKELT